MNRITSTLKHLPVFYVRGEQIRVLKTPDEFYNSLIQLASTSKTRILLSTLYIGTDELEARLVDTIDSALEQSAGDRLRVRILLDYTRGTRGKTNSCSILHPLVASYPSRVKIGLYHTPALWGFLKWALPERVCEIMGVQHMKLYVFDNTVVISGANLSDHYFKRRQDRYIVISDCKRLADFSDTLITAVSQCSFDLTPTGALVLNERAVGHPYESRLTNHESNLHFRNTLRARLQSVISQCCTYDSQHLADEHLDSCIVPLLQAGQVNVTLEEDLICKLLDNAEVNDKVHLASGYFNPSTSISNSLKKCTAETSVLLPSPSTNGFATATGLSRHIPAFYSYVAAQLSLLRVYVYNRANWSFHAKGIWFSSVATSLPYATHVGSTNYGYRSCHRDLECSLVLLTSNQALQEQLRDERDRLFVSHASPLDKTKKPWPFWMGFVWKFIRSFL